MGKQGAADSTTPSKAPPATFAIYDRPETMYGRLPGDRYLRIGGRLPGRLPAEGDFHVLAGEVPPLPTGGLRQAASQIKRVLIGRPIATADEPHERVNVVTGLAVFASDNISSSAYATEEIMRVLILAGAAAPP